MKILVACEYSGRVRDAFTAKGHNALSVDYRMTESPGTHVIADVRDIISDKWDMMIAFPPCTYLCRAGRWRYLDSPYEESALEFVRTLLDAPIPRIALENPVGRISVKVRPPTQIIEPYEFGEYYQKSTCLWLKNLPPLVDTSNNPIMFDFMKRYRDERDRSRTPKGLAEAMADQWSNYG